MKHALKILSIDGGGIKGILPSVILTEVERRTGQPIHKLFDVVAGTSTGGILAMGLCKAAPLSAKEMLSLYQKEGESIFTKRKKNFLSRLGSRFGSAGGSATQMAYDIAGIEQVLDRYFGKSRLSTAQTNLLVTSHDVEKGMPFYFSSRLAKINPKEEDFEMKEVARSTSAAPTYFEPNILSGQGESDMVLVDGGVFANNPSTLAYAEAKEIWKQRREIILPSMPTEDAKGYVAVVTPDDLDLPFYMLSLGCGFAPTTVRAKDSAKWNAFKWFEPLMADIFMRSVSESVHYSMQHLMPPYTDHSPRYERLDMEIPEKCREMDNASKENIEALVKTAELYVKMKSAEIDGICEIIG
ncbi:patatin-like phospholipase family protein [Pararhodonellum marinum]|uniref:patatin-like phospholipase family protein n=1 Tax=Pararhodonellum marinum TaxID=2755358 RepID=UPI00188E32F5|nr:patatin-like phospholipase family protein [Pararhodonellum marinum]